MSARNVSIRLKPNSLAQFSESKHRSEKIAATAWSVGYPRTRGSSPVARLPEQI